MNFQNILRTVYAGVFTLSFSTIANAAIISASDTDNDATLTFNIEDTLTIGVNQQWGTVRIVVNEFDVGFTAGDSVNINLFENDLASDDLLWQTSFTVTSGEVSIGLVDRTFALIFTPTLDDNNNAEIYADALVTKDACVAFCLNDNPITQNLNVALVNPVPVPAAAWLFGSGLIGLIGVARRKKS